MPGIHTLYGGYIVRTYFLHLITLILIGIMLITACQDNPVTPTDDSQPLVTAGDTEQHPTHYNWGFYALKVDTSDGSPEIIPVRSADWHFNLTNVLNSTMGVSAIGVPGETNISEGLIVMDVTLTHPFGTKPQFAGFDVKGVLMVPGSLTIGSLILPDAGETTLENADGYTRWWNPTEFTTPGMFGYTNGLLANAAVSQLTATVNPYKLFADVLDAHYDLSWVSGAAMDADDGRAVFTAGSANTRRYRIRFPMPGPVVTFGYAVDVSWDAPVPNPPTQIPDDFPINANQPEPWRVVLQQTASTLYYDTESASAGGVLKYQINIHDWQGRSTGNVPAEISAVRVYAPGLMASGQDAVFLNSTSTKARYTIDLTGIATPTASEPYRVVCRVESSDGTTYTQGAQPAPTDPLSSFMVADVFAMDPLCQTDANNDWLEAVPIGFEEPIVDQVCLPDDYRDFYTLEFPPGHQPTGDIRLYCDATPTTLGIYTETQTLLSEVSVASGVATLSFETLDLMPAKYYLRVLTSNNTITVPYLLELTGELQNILPETPVNVTPSTLFCDPQHVFYHNNYVFLVGYTGMWVYDVTNLSDPVQVSYNRFYAQNDICFNYPYMYVAYRPATGEGQVDLIDFTDVYNPVQYENVLHYPFELDTVISNSTHLYVASYVQPVAEVYIYDISDPTVPTEVGVFNTPYYPQLLSLMDPEGPNTHLVVGTWGELNVYNVENPASVTNTGTHNLGVFVPRSIDVHGDYIYVGIDKSGGGDGWLFIFNSPSLNFVTDLDIFGGARFLDVEWPYCYFGGDSVGLVICDITTPGSPSQVGATSLLSFGGHLAVDNDIVYIVPLSAGLQIIDCSTPITPAHVSHLKVLNAVYGMVRKGNYIIAAESGSQGYGAIKTVDITDPPNAFISGEVYPGNTQWGISLYGDLLAAHSLTEWSLYDATDPDNLSIYYNNIEINNISTIGLWGNTLYVAFSHPALQIKTYDVTNPSAPMYGTTIALPNGTYNISFGGNYMYVPTGGVVEIYSLTNPTVPNLVHSYVTSIFGYDDVVIQGNYMYTVGGDIFEIVDITTPGTPVFQGSVQVPTTSMNYYYTIDIEGQLAYVTGYTAKTHSVLAWPPDSPAAISLVDDYYWGARELIATDEYLYQGQESWGLLIHDLH